MSFYDLPVEIIDIILHMVNSPIVLCFVCHEWTDIIRRVTNKITESMTKTAVRKTRKGIRITNTRNFLINSVKNGHLNLLMWAQEKKCPYISRMSSHAAECGQLEILKWISKDNFIWSTKTCASAAGSGYLDIISNFY